MRKILFRGKRIDNGEWVGGAFLNDRDGAFYICPAVSDISYGDNGNRRRIGCWYSVDPSTVGQYTGLTDKDGKKIFEGDICRNTITGEIVYVKWSGVFAGYIWLNQNKGNSKLRNFGELFKVYDKLKVIGNIHDNPELM